MSVHSSAVIRAEPDGYDMAQAKLMGRQAAGHGFLRAAVAARGDDPIHALTRNATGARGFAAIVGGIDPAARIETIDYNQLDRVSKVGVLYLVDISVATHARLRLRTGPGSFSLCGVTHTTASATSMDEVVGLFREPVMPWDAVVCTTSAVVETVRRVHEAEADYLRWRFGDAVRLESPQLPVIPLGVHCRDFETSLQARADARNALDLAPDTVTALFVGRLVFHAKAHPYPMYLSLQAAAQRTGRPVALLMCGWAPTESISQAFIAGAAQFAPDVRTIFVEGRDPPQRDRAWAAADIFVSLSDNIQETFGLTPIEAMAAGLPVVATDWNGYRDTIRPGIDGYRVRTWSPAPGMGAPIARAHEHGAMTYDQYCWSAAATTAVDLDELAEVLSGLISNPDLRHSLGESGRRRAREVFDWPVVYRQYQALWADLNERRRAALADPDVVARLRAAPQAGAARLDPYYAFGHYPTAHIVSDTRLSVAPGATAERLAATLNHPLFGGLPAPAGYLQQVFAAIASGETTITATAQALRASPPAIARAVGILAKAGAVRLG